MTLLIFSSQNVTPIHAREITHNNSPISLPIHSSVTKMADEDIHKKRLKFIEDQVLNPNSPISVDGLLVRLLV